MKMIKLSDERGMQLQAYADAHDYGVAEAIGALLREAGATDRVPGFDAMAINPERSLILLGIDEFSALVRREHVATIASVIEDRCASSRLRGRHIDITRDGETKVLLIGRNSRNSIVIVAKDEAKGIEVRRVLPLDMGIDLAAQLRNSLVAH